MKKKKEKQKGKLIYLVHRAYWQDNKFLTFWAEQRLSHLNIYHLGMMVATQYVFIFMKVSDCLF